MFGEARADVARAFGVFTQLFVAPRSSDALIEQVCVLSIDSNTEATVEQKRYAHFERTALGALRLGCREAAVIYAAQEAYRHAPVAEIHRGLNRFLATNEEAKKLSKLELMVNVVLYASIASANFARNEDVIQLLEIYREVGEDLTRGDAGCTRHEVEILAALWEHILDGVRRLPCGRRAVIDRFIVYACRRRRTRDRWLRDAVLGVGMSGRRAIN